MEAIETYLNVLKKTQFIKFSGVKIYVISQPKT